MATLTPPVSISHENEKNPWLAAAARFDEAAARLKLDDGMRKVLGTLGQGNHRPHSGAARRRPPRSLHRLSRAALRGARSGQGRHPLRAGRDAGRSARAGLLDDVEMRGGQHPVRRRQGRRDLRSERALRGRTGKLTRRYTAEIIDFIGPERDVPAPDVNTNEQVMAWIMDTYSMHARHTVTAVVTGKPMALGGSRGRPEATGRGCMIVTLQGAAAVRPDAGDHARGDPGLRQRRAAWRPS